MGGEEGELHNQINSTLYIHTLIKKYSVCVRAYVVRVVFLVHCHLTNVYEPVYLP